MKFKLKCTILFGSLFLAGLSFAGDQTPSECPNISTIQHGGIWGISRGFFGSSDEYSGYTASNYNTKYLWLFVLGQFQSESLSAALTRVNEVLPYLYGDPVPARKYRGWICEYSGADEINGAYAYLPDERLSSQQMLNQFIK